MKRHAALFRRVCRVYGTWPKALAAAGLAISHRHSSPLLVLRALRDALEGPLKVRHSANPESAGGALLRQLKKGGCRVDSGWRVPGASGKSSPAFGGYIAREKGALMRRLGVIINRCKRRRSVPWELAKALHAAGINANLYFVHHKRLRIER
jgi:hypothetical protein